MPRRAGWRPLAGRILARGPYVGQAWSRRLYILMIFSIIITPFLLQNCNYLLDICALLITNFYQLIYMSFIIIVSQHSIVLIVQVHHPIPWSIMICKHIYSHSPSLFLSRLEKASRSLCSCWRMYCTNSPKSIRVFVSMSAL